MQEKGKLKQTSTPFIFVTILALLVTVGCCPLSTIQRLAPLEEAPPLSALSTAHRGSLHQGLPDNSLPALAESIKAGVPLLEVDVRRSHSGDLFLFHDSTFSHTNSFAPCRFLGREVQSLSSAERAEVFLDRKRSIAIPLLREALELAKGSSSKLQLDLKQESDELLYAVVAEIDAAQAQTNVVIQIKDPPRVVLLKASHPTLSVLARCKNEEQVVSAVAAGANYLELERWVSAPAIDLAHMAGIPVLVNVSSSFLDTPAVHEYLRSRGVDIIMSDRAR
jgi:glycerophosphoryl diester phosphodiesterase